MICSECCHLVACQFCADNLLKYEGVDEFRESRECHTSDSSGGCVSGSGSSNALNSDENAEGLLTRLPVKQCPHCKEKSSEGHIVYLEEVTAFDKICEMLHWAPV